MNDPCHFAEARSVARLVPMSHLLEILRFRLNTRSRRCACVLHEGSNPSAFSWTEEGLWKCFACGAGGDKITLIRAVRKCSFREAMVFLAVLAGVGSPSGERSYAEIEKDRGRRRAAERAATLLAETQHALCLALGNELESLRRIYRRASQDLRAGRRQQLCWDALKFVADNLPQRDAAYCIAALAAPLERAEFAMYPDQRARMIAVALERGYVSDAKGYRFEVPVQ